MPPQIPGRRQHLVGALLVALLALVGLGALAAPAAAQEASRVEDGAAVQRLLELMNRDRADAGLPPLSLRADVVEVALAWSHRMADAGQLAHNDAWFTPASRERHGAKALAENVAVNASVDDTHARLMASPGHRANILDGRLTVVGIAVVRTPDGSSWTTQDFLEPRGTAAAAAPAPAPAPPAPAPPPAPAVAAPPSTVAAPAPTLDAPAPAPAPAAPATTAPPPAAAAEAAAPEAPPATLPSEPVGPVGPVGPPPSLLQQSLAVQPVDVPSGTGPSGPDAVLRALAALALVAVAVPLERRFTGPARTALLADRRRRAAVAL